MHVIDLQLPAPSKLYKCTSGAILTCHINNSQTFQTCRSQWMLHTPVSVYYASSGDSFSYQDYTRRAHDKRQENFQMFWAFVRKRKHAVKTLNIVIHGGNVHEHAHEHCHTCVWWISEHMYDRLDRRLEHPEHLVYRFFSCVIFQDIDSLNADKGMKFVCIDNIPEGKLVLSKQLGQVCYLPIKLQSCFVFLQHLRAFTFEALYIDCWLKFNIDGFSLYFYLDSGNLLKSTTDFWLLAGSRYPTPLSSEWRLLWKY